MSGVLAEARFGDSPDQGPDDSGQQQEEGNKVECEQEADQAIIYFSQNMGTIILLALYHCIY